MDMNQSGLKWKNMIRDSGVHEFTFLIEYVRLIPVRNLNGVTMREYFLVMSVRRRS